MKTFYLFIICVLGFDSIAIAQVIYERTFSPVFPSLEHTFQLSDTSTVSFANNSECYFAAYLHIDKNGNEIKSGGLPCESTHSLGVRSIGLDSILIWNREGPLDFDGPNYFNIGLWAFDEYVTLVKDSLEYRFWEDLDIPYEAYLLKDDKIVYRKDDTLYVLQISTQQLLNKVAIPEFSIVNPFLDYIVVFAYPDDPVVLSIDLVQVSSWDLNQHPVSQYESMALDSFLIGIITQEDAKLHVVNGLTEASFDLDLTGYFTHIEEIQVKKDGLFVKGKNGTLNYLIQLNDQFQIINETIVDLPDLAGQFTYTYYADRVYGWKIDGRANYRITYHYPDANPIHFVDVSMDTIWVDSIYFWPPEMHFSANVYLLAQVTNHSPDTVNSLTFYFVDTPFGQCDSGVYPQFVEGLSIPPGDSVNVPLFTWSWEITDHKPFFRMFYVQHANHHLDDNYADNYFQLTYLLSDVNTVTENSLSIWPNPFHDYLESPEDFENLKMYNSLGHVVSTGINRLENLGSLVPGAYYVQGLRNHKIFLTRVIKIE